MKKNKLSDMDYSSVDLVKAGANQRAEIKLFKSDGGEPADERTALRKAWEYLKELFSTEPLPPPQKPAQTITKADITAEYSQYIDMLQKSFDLIMDDEATTPDEKRDQLRKSLSEFQAFMYPATSEWPNMRSIAKSAQSFDETRKLAERRDGQWRYVSALDESIASIAGDDDTDNSEKVRMISESIDQFATAYKAFFADVFNSPGSNPSDTKPSEPTQKADTPTQTNTAEKESAIKMDMNNLTPEEQKTLKALMDKANGGVQTDAEKGCGGKSNAEKGCGGNTDTEKSKCKKSFELPDAVQKALDRSEAFIEKMEQNEQVELAKKYEVLGEKPEEFGKTLYELKKKDESAYNSCIAMLDKQVELINKSGLFTEIGKSGANYSAVDGTVGKVESIAKGYMDADPALSWHAAMAKAWDNHPELIAEYEG